MPDARMKISRTFGKLALESHRSRQDVMSSSRSYRLRDALTDAGRALKWTKEKTDYSAAVNDVMMLAMAGIEEELRTLAREIHESLGTKSALRETISALRAAVADPDTTYPFDLVYHYTLFVDGAYEVKEEKATIGDRSDGLALLEVLETLLESSLETTGMMIANLQSRQHELATITSSFSNILKQWHDTTKAVIENLR